MDGGTKHEVMVDRRSDGMDRRAFIQGGLVTLRALTAASMLPGLIGCASSVDDSAEGGQPIETAAAEPEETTTDSSGLTDQLTGLVDTPSDDMSPTMSLIAISDAHIGSTTKPDVEEHLAAALADIRDVAPDADGIFLNGDLTDNGYQEQYDTLRSIMETAGFSLSDFTFSIGNHDTRVESEESESYETLRARFLENTGVSNLYYDTTIAGQHVIVLGCDETPSSWDCSVISDAQIAWLDGLLAADRAAGKLSFVFNHFPIIGTMGAAGQTTWAQGSRLENSDAVNAVLSGYPQVVYVGGHYHSDLFAYHVTEDSPIYVNDGSVGYASGIHGALYQTVDDSYGWYIELFDDRIRFRGRDFLEREWIGNKDFTISTDRMLSATV